MKIAHFASISTMAALALVVASSLPATANAAFHVADDIVSLNGLASMPADPSDGISLDLGKAGSLNIGLPAADTASSAQLIGGEVTYDNNDGSKTTPVVPADGGLQILTTIEEAGAPTTYEYDFAAQGEPVVLALLEGGGVLVSDSDGVVINLLAAPWAFDATGAAVPTWYSVDGNVLTQHVQHAGAAYPVVADPRLTCDALFCTVVLSKAETQTVASHGGTAAAIMGAACALLGTVVAGALCAAGASWAQGTASDALAQGRCLGVRKFHYVAAATFPVVTAC